MFIKNIDRKTNEIYRKCNNSVAIFVKLSRWKNTKIVWSITTFLVWTPSLERCGVCGVHTHNCVWMWRFSSILQPCSDFIFWVRPVITRTNQAKCHLHIFPPLLPGHASVMRFACLFARAVFLARVTLWRGAFRGFQTGFLRRKSA